MEKPVLVFVHGLGENLESWTYQLQYFDKDYRVIAMDLRGHGRTNDGIVPLTMRRLALDVIALIDYLAIDKMHLVGLSMGGMIALELTKEHQQRLQSISLCNTMAYPIDNDKIAIANRVGMLQMVPMSTVAEYVTNKCLAQENNQILHEQVLKMFLNNRLLPYMAATIAVFSIDYRSQLAKINLPTLIMVGDVDTVTPISCAEYMHENIINSKLKVIKHAGHLSKLEQPQQFNQNLAEFLR